MRRRQPLEGHAGSTRRSADGHLGGSQEMLLSLFHRFPFPCIWSCFPPTFSCQGRGQSGGEDLWPCPSPPCPCTPATRRQRQSQATADRQRRCEGKRLRRLGSLVGGRNGLQASSSQMMRAMSAMVAPGGLFHSWGPTGSLRQEGPVVDEEGPRRMENSITVCRPIAEVPEGTAGRRDSPRAAPALATQYPGLDNFRNGVGVVRIGGRSPQGPTRINPLLTRTPPEWAAKVPWPRRPADRGRGDGAPKQ